MQNELDLLRKIAFNIAMIDIEYSTEHDDALFDDAYEKAREWQEKYNETISN